MVIVEYFLYFIIYAFIGWCLEGFCKLVETKQFVNRGFLIGPICPIYGYGVLFILLLIGNNTSDILAVFLKSILICSVLEYFTSYFMEKLFHARWWDYSRKKFNINGRICLETMIPFGILGTVVIYIIHPFIKMIISLFSKNMLIVIASILFIIYLVDNIISYNVINKIKNEIKSEKKDNTEIIKEKILVWLNNNSYFYRRFKRAFPDFIIIIKEIRRGIGKDLDRKLKNSKKR